MEWNTSAPDDVNLLVENVSSMDTGTGIMLDINKE
jgi:hypothetical protein